jgi:prepilin-type processing-associated H-X9-DG protein
MRSKGTGRIEIAVVTTVVVVSAALLLPAFGARRTTDKLTGCLARTRNLSAAILQYTEDFDGILPPGKYGHQGGHPVPKVWMELLYELEYVPEKEDFQCPADDVTNNEALYYDYGPQWPDWWASYAMSMHLCDLFWTTHAPFAAVLSNHDGFFDTQVLVGESESNSILGYWFGSGPGSDAWSFRGSYVRQFPFERHKGFCTYAMLDGHAKVMRVPASDAGDDAKFEAEIRSQFEECDGPTQESELSPHVCFWNRYRRALYGADFFPDW